jgi:SWIB/MDM2 domain
MKTLLIDEIDKLSAKIASIEAGLTKKDRKDLIAQMQRVKKYSKTAKQRRAEAAADVAGAACDAAPAAGASHAIPMALPVVKVNHQFNRPRPVDKLMADFAGWEVGSEHSRNEISNSINAYIKREHLQSIPGNGRLIVPDEKLRELLNYRSEPTITYPHIQKYIGARFVS